MLAVRVPVDGSARLLIMGGDLLFRDPVVAVIPAHDGPIVSTKGKLDGIGGRPLNVIYGTAEAGILVSAAAGHDVFPRVTEVPQADGGVMACRQQKVALVRVEG